MDSIGQSYGTPFHGEVSSADASAGVSFVLYNAEGGTITLGSNQRLVIEGGMAIAASAGNQVIAVTTDAAGKRLRKGTFTAGSGFAFAGLKLWCPKGVTPKYFAPLGQSDCQIEGRIITTN